MMTKEQIDKLLSNGIFPEYTENRELVETHISWVILCDQFVYKIKKPIKYSFLDFSTLELRKHFCERELELNRRFTKNIYIEVMPIYYFESEDRYCVGGAEGTILDYCTKMYKLDPEKQMDVLLSKNKVSEFDIKNLAITIADFHKSTEVIYKKNVFYIGKNSMIWERKKDFLKSNLAC